MYGCGLAPGLGLPSAVTSKVHRSTPVSGDVSLKRIRRPSFDQSVGCCRFSDSKTRSSPPLPSTGIRNKLNGVPVLNRMVRPSGDHTGEMSTPRDVSRLATPRAVSSSQMSAGPARTVTTWRPSGEIRLKTYSAGSPRIPTCLPVRSNHWNCREEGEGAYTRTLLLTLTPEAGSATEKLSPLS